MISRHHRGYVMLVVIAVSVLMITLLSMLANLSLRRGLEAADAERSLQQRWGAITFERALLNAAPKLFEVREELAAAQTPGKPPPPFIRTAITIRGVTFDILIGDEDAKLNLNALYHRTGIARASSDALQMLSPAAGRSLRMVPAAEPMHLERESARIGASTEFEVSDAGPPAAFRSWGEVFDLSSLAASASGDATLPNVTTGMTCWGSGQLNFRRASDQAILAIAGAVVQDGGARRLLTRYRSSPTATLAVLLQTEVSSARHRDALSRLTSETSSCFSIWIVASHRGQGALRQFTVQELDDEGVLRVNRFVQ